MLSPMHQLWFAADGGKADQATPAFLSLFADTAAKTAPKRGDDIVRMYDELRPSLLPYLVGLGLVRGAFERIARG
jgi:hypothetical protein